MGARIADFIKTNCPKKAKLKKRKACATLTNGVSLMMKHVKIRDLNLISFTVAHSRGLNVKLGAVLNEYSMRVSAGVSLEIKLLLITLLTAESLVTIHKHTSVHTHKYTHIHTVHTKIQAH